MIKARVSIRKPNLFEFKVAKAGYRPALTKEVSKTLTELVDLFMQKLVDHIDRQDLDWPELSERHIRRKGHADAWYWQFDLIDSMDLLKEKEVYTGSPKHRHIPSVRYVTRAEYELSFPKGLTHYSGFGYEELAVILELGSKDGRIPPRPLFEHVWKEVLEEADIKMSKAAKRGLSDFL